MALIANQACGGARFAAFLKVSSVRANAALLIFHYESKFDGCIC